VGIKNGKLLRQRHTQNRNKTGVRGGYWCVRGSREKIPVISMGVKEKGGISRWGEGERMGAKRHADAP